MTVRASRRELDDRAAAVVEIVEMEIVRAGGEFDAAGVNLAVDEKDRAIIKVAVRE
jgi:hypothetical protein